ncbi:MAG: hypothetical protein QOJ37_2871, partial [Pseudonocardiales bacterium]|nr:hypothetical protein [Pseudonocardiales bacterium]
KHLSVYGLEDYTRIKHVMHNNGSRTMGPPRCPVLPRGA